MALPDIGLLGKGLNSLGIQYNYTRDPTAAWFTLFLMDIWHWTSLVVLLCYSGLVAIPDAYYQAAKVDGASALAVFRFIQLPKLKHVLTIAILLRFMDSFMIYTEVIVLTGGGPGSATKLLSIDLVQKALGSQDLGPGRRLLDHLLPAGAAVQLAVLHADDEERGEMKNTPVAATGGRPCRRTAVPKVHRQCQQRGDRRSPLHGGFLTPNP